MEDVHVDQLADDYRKEPTVQVLDVGIDKIDDYYRQWIERHKRFHLHFIPTSSSWLNLVERWFGEITRKQIRRGVFKSVKELIEAIETYVKTNNQNPKPFVWTKRVDEILEKVNHCKASTVTAH